jgi:hypothetical protein
MTDDDLKVIEERANAASSGPSTDHHHISYNSCCELARVDLPKIITALREAWKENFRDEYDNLCKFTNDIEVKYENLISSQPLYISKLEAELREAREELNRMQAKAEKQFALYESRIGRLVAENKEGLKTPQVPWWLNTSSEEEEK